jgi:ribosomal protein L37E
VGRARTDALCGKCGIRPHLAVGKPCPVCGSTLVVDRSDVGEVPIVITLKFIVWECDHCGADSMMDQDHICPHCGVPYDSEGDSRALQRMTAFADDVRRLQELADGVQHLPFASRGVRLRPADYSRWFRREGTDPCLAFMARTKRQLARGEWDAASKSKTQRCWTDIQAACAALAERVEMLAATPAPTLFITIHRRLVQSTAAMLQAMVTAISSIVAPYHRIAQQRMQEGERALSDAGAMLGRLDDVFPLVVDVIRKPAVLAGDRDGDVSTLGRVFPELLGTAAVRPSILHPLGPFGVAGLLLQDSVRRGRRVDQAFRLLLGADLSNPGWIAAPDVLVRLAGDAWKQLGAQHTRLVRELATPEADGFMDAVLDILSKVAEGPFRRYGSIFTVASQVAAGTSVVLDEDGLFKHRKLGDVHTKLATSAPLILEDINKLLRNAEAHYDYLVLPSAVRVRHLPPYATSASDAKVDYLTHDDVVEQVLNLVEATLAMAEALLLYVANHRDIALRQGFLGAWA